MSIDKKKWEKVVVFNYSVRRTCETLRQVRILEAELQNERVAQKCFKTLDLVINHMH